MATRIASSVAGVYPIGNDTTGNGTAGNPYLTLSKLLSLQADGDLLLHDGPQTASSSLAQGLNYFNVTARCTVQAVTLNTYPLRCAAGQARVFNVLVVGGAVTIDGGILDSQSSGAYPVSVHASNTADVTVQNCTLKDPGTDRMLNDPNTSSKLIVRNVTLSGAATTGGIVVSAMGATKRVEINGATGSVTGITASKGGAIVLTATATGASARIENCNGLQATSNGSGSSCSPIHLVGVPAVVQNNKAMQVNEVAANSSSGLVLVEPLGFQSDGGEIIGNSGYNSCSGGYLTRVGTDGAGANDNRTNNWISADNDWRGNPAASIMHGVMFGSCVGGLACEDTIREVSIPLLSKLQTTGAIFLRPRVEMPVGTTAVFYSKGSVGAKCIGAQVRMRRSAGYYIFRVDDDPTIPTHSTGAVCSAANIWSDDPAGVSLVALVPANNTATFDNNNYYFAGGVTGTPWSINGTGYATFTAWQAAQELTARQVDPTSLNTQFHKNSYIPLLTAGLVSGPMLSIMLAGTLP